MASAAVDHDARFRRALVTPEGVDLRVQLGPASARAGAFLLDLAILGGTLFAFIILAGITGLSLAAARAAGAFEATGIVVILTLFAIRNAYFIVMESGRRAATFGKRAFGLRVVARDGGRLDTDAVVARNLMRDIEVFVPLAFLGSHAGGDDVDGWLTLLGFGWSAVFLFFPLFNRDRLRAGDLVAGTWVVRAPRRVLLDDVAAGTMLARADADTFTEAELALYGVFELQTLEDVLRRGDHEAIGTVAATIRAKMGRAETGGDGRAFLTAYYAALRPRLEQGLLFGQRRADKHDAPRRALGPPVAPFSEAELTLYTDRQRGVLARVLASGDPAQITEAAAAIRAKMRRPDDGDALGFLDAYAQALARRFE